MEEINKAYATFRERDRIASLGGGVEKIEKQHESGKMTARERIEMLLDKGTFVELDKLMVHRCTNYGMDKNKIPGDGIVSGYGKIDGRQVFVYAYDFTVCGGSLSASNAKKIVKVQQLALKNGAPIIALNDSGGARIQEGIESLSGYADIFYQNTMASGVIPQISAILGPCAGGACYSPALTDFIFMVKEKSHMFVTGPDVVKTVIHEEVSKEELGGAMTHSSKSGVTHFMCNTEEELLMSIRELLSFLPQNNMDETKKQNCTDETNREDAVLDTIVPADPNVPYDMKDIIENEEYIDYTDFFNSGLKEEEEVVTTNVPYVISPEEFGEFEDYGKVDLIYYNDGVLVEDGTDEVIEDINEVIGLESLKHFGEHEEETVHVRNDELKTDYEVLLDARNYAELEE